MAERACHVVGFALQFGLTLVLAAARGKFMKRLIPILLLLLSACVSTEMKGYVGKDIREVILTNGQPMGVMDMGDGSRAFQFMWGGSSQAAVTSSSATQVNGDWLGKASVQSSGSAVVSSGCVIAYIAQWDDTRKSWIVVDYRYPNKIVC
ncbi:hypothetical protein [Stenotrophomonas koreensis]|uniref:hypothetical protein n=1 Tax=Stenotrophomonas koreensis TaxID=266128 RepID=UPI00070B9818|nr:hypothetical protein [Stenotrophomonas koreensis]